MFEIQEHHGSGDIYTASITVMGEVVKVWKNAGYGDILQDIFFIKRKISTLHESRILQGVNEDSFFTKTN